MSRSRIIRPEFWSDEKLAKHSREIRLFFAGLWGTSDDYGSTKGNAAYLRAQIFPYDDLPLNTIQSWLDELEHAGRIIAYLIDDEKFYWIVNFKKHQPVDHPSKQRNPVPDGGFEALAKSSRNTRETVASPSEKKPLLTDTDTETETDTEARNFTPEKITEPDPIIEPKIADKKPDEKSVRIKKRIEPEYSPEIMAIAVQHISNVGSACPQAAAKLDAMNQAEGIRKLIVLDKLSVADVAEMIQFVSTDDFWRPNVISLVALRNKSKNGVAKWVNIQAKMKERQGQKGEPETVETPEAKTLREARECYNKKAGACDLIASGKPSTEKCKACFRYHRIET